MQFTAKMQYLNYYTATVLIKTSGATKRKVNNKQFSLTKFFEQFPEFWSIP